VLEAKSGRPGSSPSKLTDEVKAPRCRGASRARGGRARPWPDQRARQDARDGLGLVAWSGSSSPMSPALGTEAITGKPYKPTTQGRNERFHQTLFRYLDKQPLAATPAPGIGYVDNGRPRGSRPKNPAGVTEVLTHQQSPMS
jgi:transposase InsO family protein